MISKYKGVGKTSSKLTSKVDEVFPMLMKFFQRRWSFSNGVEVFPTTMKFFFLAFGKYSSYDFDRYCTYFHELVNKISLIRTKCRAYRIKVWKNLTKVNFCDPNCNKYLTNLVSLPFELKFWYKWSTELILVWLNWHFPTII